jgi:hypothetical protein
MENLIIKKLKAMPEPTKWPFRKAKAPTVKDTCRTALRTLQTTVSSCKHLDGGIDTDPDYGESRSHLCQMYSSPRVLNDNTNSDIIQIYVLIPLLDYTMTCSSS